MSTKVSPAQNDAWSKLQLRIINCRRCPRLMAYGQAVATEKRKAFRDEDYWGRPVPNFGSAPTSLLVVGLAPAAHGAHRTGRMFTGDQSGRWLYRALHKFGFATTSGWERAEDNQLRQAVITAVAHCAPPDNKPSRDEILNCAEHFDATLATARTRAILCLGKIAWDAVATRAKVATKVNKQASRPPAFAHGASYFMPDIWGNSDKEVFVIGSYHPSQQNTFTGRLTEEMFDEVFRELRTKLSGKPKLG
ncbi:MAG TPA: uracil-DNA glycosylase [Pseudobdellovibrionaceae bacterium]|nr:uracil-DNA glycosylase [Pseudobdellovibrionaceae bacterium]